jgi:hypothetical protein
MTIDTPSAPAGARNATLADIAALLRDQQALKSDFVVPAAAIRARGGRLAVDDSAPVLSPDGVTLTAGMYTPTGVCDQGIADISRGFANSEGMLAMNPRVVGHSG